MFAILLATAQLACTPGGAGFGVSEYPRAPPGESHDPASGRPASAAATNVNKHSILAAGESYLSFQDGPGTSAKWGELAVEDSRG